jgi:acyl-CoA thioester hydrolase
MLTHVSAFKIRYHECDAYGHLNNTNYARFMQESAFDASAALGYDSAWYMKSNCAFIIRASEIEYIKPVLYGDTIEVKTWVSDFRRVSSRRRYEMRSAKTGEIVCKAHSDWAFIDRTTLRPIAIPDELARAFMPDVQGEVSREKFPDSPAPPEGAYTMRRAVRFHDIDGMNHVNNAAYLEYCEDCGFECVAHFGWSASRMMSLGFGIVYRKLWIEHLQAAQLDDEIDVVAWLSDVRRVSGTRHFTLTRVRDGALLARCVTYAACVNLQTSLPMRWHEDMLKDFKTNIAD